MNISKRNFIFLLLFLLSFIFGLVSVSFIFLSKKIDTKVVDIKKTEKENLITNIDYSPLVERLMHSVVSIDAIGKDEIANPIAEMLKNLPFKDNLNEFLKNKKIKKKFHHIGSGFYFKENGYIITNAHVVENAQEIKIKDSKDKEYEAKIVGIDKVTDIGVLKIDKKNDLQIASVGNSDDIKIGEVVITIGNPFNLPNTVTAGIISAKNRKLENPFVNYIQTDSAINQGNSGGPMFNLKGEVIGINTLILSQNGGNIGLGFAIPSGLVSEIAETIIKDGKITRTKIGIICRDIPSDINLQKALNVKTGALILDFDKKSNAFVSGLKKGDVIIKINNEDIIDFRSLAVLVSKKKPNEKINIEVMRYGKKMTFVVELKKREENESLSVDREEKSKMIKGILVSNLSENEELEENSFKCRKQGVVIKDIENEYILEDEGSLMAGDIVYQINQTSVYDLNSFEEAIKKIDKYGVFYIKRENINLINGVKIQ